MKISLHGFCKLHNLAKSTVSRRCKALGIDASDGLSAGDVDLLKLDFDLMEEEAVVDVASEVIEPVSGGLQLAGNQGIPPVPQFNATGFGDTRSIAIARGYQGQQNLATYLAAASAQYLHMKTVEHFAGIDAAFAAAQQQMSGQADQSIRGESAG